MENYKSFGRYAHNLAETMQSVCETSVNLLIDSIWKALLLDCTFAICGNGGSLSTSEHFACDLKRPRKGKIPIGKIFSLNFNSPFLTAVANDTDYSEIFAQQAENCLRKNDFLICFSYSGTSNNIINVINMAHELGAQIAVFTGSRDLPPAISSKVAHIIKVNSQEISLVEDTHLALSHYIAEEIAFRFSSEDGKINCSSL